MFFRGQDIHALGRHERGGYRRAVQAVFQDPFSSLNPRLTIRTTVSEPLAQTEPDLTRAEVTDRVAASLTRVGLAAAHRRRLSARAVGRPAPAGRDRARADHESECILLDEAVSALDVSIRAQVMNLLREIQDRSGVSYLFIAHDLAVVKYVSTRIGVMYLGKLVETGGCRRALRESAPSVHAGAAEQRAARASRRRARGSDPQRARCRAPSTRRRAVASTRAARRHCRSAARWSRPYAIRRAVTRSRVTCTEATPQAPRRTSGRARRPTRIPGA